MIFIKKCIKCNLLLPNEEFYFRKDSNTYRNECKECHHKQTKKYRQKNKERLNKISREYHKKHREKLNKISGKYHEKHKEEQNTKRREYHKKHREKEIIIRRKYYQKNKDTINKKRREEKDRLNKIRRKWRNKNKDKVNATIRERTLKKKQLFEDFTLEEWLQKVELTNGICSICGRLYSEVHPFCVTLDHTPPISKAVIGFHYTIENVTPMCGSCNSSKMNKLI